MDIIRAKEIVSALAEGIDPTTGEVLSEDCVCNKGEIVRALYAVLAVCEQAEQVKKTTDKAPTTKEPEDYDVTLYELLRKLRNKIAEDHGVPPFVVLTNLPLKYLALLKPTALEEFAEIRGIGKGKAEQYGDVFLNEIKGYISKYV